MKSHKGRASIADLHIGVTVQEGNKRESEIKEALRKQGLQLRDKSSHEDRHDKIDAHLQVTPKAIECYPELKADLGNEVPIQIKDREGSYADFLFEARSDRYEKAAPGRDYKSKAKYFFCRPAGTSIHCVATELLRAIADRGLELHKEAMEKDERSVHSSAKYPGIELRRHYDRRDDYWKVLLFVPYKVINDL